VLARDHDLRVIAPIAWTDALAFRRQGRPPLPRQATWDGIPVEYPLYLFPPRVLRGWYGHCFRASVRSAFRRAVEEFRPDLVFAPWAFPDGWAAVQLARRAGLPVVVSALGSDVLMVRPHSLRHRRTIAGLGQADAVITVSQDLADHVTPYGVDPGRIHVICTGVDPTWFHWGPQDEARKRLGLGTEPLILAVGNLVPVKGMDVLVEACDRLAKSGVDFRCVIIGDGPMRPQLERQIAAAGLGDRLRLLGSRPHETLPDWFRAATVVTLPSRSEGVPNVQLEAAACGTPFVATRVGGIPEFAHLGRTTLVPPDDDAKLAGTLAAVLRDPLPRTPPAPESTRSINDVVDDMARLFAQVLAARAAADLAPQSWSRRAAGPVGRPAPAAEELVK